jgi:NitT/TauT family transport system permease protein
MSDIASKPEVALSGPVFTESAGRAPEKNRGGALGRKTKLRSGAIMVNVLRVAVLFIAIALWQISADTEFIATLFTSSPRDIAYRLAEWAANGTALTNAAVTIEEALLGWAIGSIVGVLFGYLFAAVPLLDKVFSPYIEALNATPRLALAPLFILWFGVGIESKLALVISVVVIILLVSANTGAKSAEREPVTLVKALGGTPLQIAWKVVIPSSIPFVFAGLRLAMNMALGGAVVGEMMAARRGLGVLINNSSTVLDTTGVMAGVVLTVAVALVATMILTHVEQRILKWKSLT